MKIVVKEVGKKPEVREINGNLHEMQEIVGGYIECVHIGTQIACVCNEMGKLNGLRPNFMLDGDIIVGDVFFVGVGFDDFKSLSLKQIQFIKDAFRM